MKKVRHMGNVDLKHPELEYSEVEERIVTVKGQRVILDCDVALLYKVETKRVNEAVKNNPEKFPSGYVFELTSDEVERLRSKISTLNMRGRGQHTKYLPKAFTEKGLYMLATILKSPVATCTTISIIETFAKIKELSRCLNDLSKAEDDGLKKAIVQKSGNIISDIISDNSLVSDTETTFEVNLAMLKFKHTIKRKNK